MLLLREPRLSDGNDLFHYIWSRPEVTKYLFWREVTTEEAAQKKTQWLLECRAEIPATYVIEETDSRTAIGFAYMKEMQPGYFGVGDIVIAPEFQGRGYGKQVVTAFLKEAFIDHGASRFEYCYVEGNEASRRLAESCGLHYVREERVRMAKIDADVTLKYYETTTMPKKITR